MSYGNWQLLRSVTNEVMNHFCYSGYKGFCCSFPQLRIISIQFIFSVHNIHCNLNTPTLLYLSEFRLLIVLIFFVLIRC